MKFLARITLVLIFVALPSLCVAQDGPPPPPAPAIEYNQNSWRTFSSDAGFSVLIPGKPTYSEQKLDGTSEERVQHTYTLTTGTGSYVIMYSDFPAPLSEPSLIKNVLEVAREMLLAQSSDTKLLKEQEINIEGNPGGEFLVQNGDITQRWRILVAGNRVYQIALAVKRNTAFSTGRPSSNPADFTDFYRMMSGRYFDSFRLLEAPYTTDGEIDRLLRENRMQVYGSSDKAAAGGSGDIIEFQNISPPTRLLLAPRK